MRSRYDNISPRATRRRRSADESIANSRLTILINMAIEIIAALIMSVGVIYLVRYMFHFRHRMVETYFNGFLWAIAIFSVGWGIYIVVKLRRHYLLYKQLKKEDSPPPDDSSGDAG